MSKELKTNIDEIEPSGNDLINKELLTPLEALKELKSFCGDVYYNEIYDKDYEIIEAALKEKERLKSRENSVLPNDEFIGDLGEHTRDEVAMKIKALEIIKEKEVNVSLVHHSSSARDYNYAIDRAEMYLNAGEYGLRSRHLSQAEFESLKEVLL